MFLPVGLLTDISRLGSDPVPRLVLEMLFGGGIAVAYVVAVRRPRWLPVLILAHILLSMELTRLGRTAPLSGASLAARIQADTSGVVASLIASFVLLSNFVQREGSRYVRAHTEIALARDIHRLLVPTIARRVGCFEFQGVSLASGDVGGDLLDVVESNDGWIGYVADVSGHGVGAGLLMGMVKSATHMQLQVMHPIDQLLTNLNTVLLDLKKAGDVCHGCGPSIRRRVPIAVLGCRPSSDPALPRNQRDRRRALGATTAGRDVPRSGVCGLERRMGTGGPFRNSHRRPDGSLRSSTIASSASSASRI